MEKITELINSLPVDANRKQNLLSKLGGKNPDMDQVLAEIGDILDQEEASILSLDPEAAEKVSAAVKEARVEMDSAEADFKKTLGDLIREAQDLGDQTAQELSKSD